MFRYLVAILLAALVALPIGARATDKETIAVIGTGDLGDSIGGRLATLGYKVVYGSRDPKSEDVKQVVAKTGHDATAATPTEAARQADIVFLPVPQSVIRSVGTNLGNLDGKIVVDPTVPWMQGEDGYPAINPETSSAEFIQQSNQGAKVVKAFSTMGSMVIDDPAVTAHPVTIPIASNHKDAKERIARLVNEMGLEPVDFGPLRMARFMEALGVIYMIPLLQGRDSEWEFRFMRNNDWACRFPEDWADPVYDAEDLALLPGNEDARSGCP